MTNTGAEGPPWRVYLSPPEVGQDERELLLAAFDSGWVAPAGPDLAAFESELAEMLGVRAVAALSSGTAALHLAMMVTGIGPGDDVLVSDMTFAPSAFAVTYLGARPCFIDSETTTWHMDPELLHQELRRRAGIGQLPAAVLVVDLYGSVADVVRLGAICREYEVPLIEDAAEAVGARRDGCPAGGFGATSVLSFNGNKIVTTGGGGAVSSNDEKLIGRARHLATQARVAVPWYEHEEVGFNYRLGNLGAAVGRGQLRTLPARIAGRRRVHERYVQILGAVEGVRFQSIPQHCEPNHWLTTVSIDPVRFGASATDVLATLRAAGIEARHGFKPMHMQPVFAMHPVVGGEVSEWLFATAVSLPSGSRLVDAEVAWISEVVLSARA